MKDSSAAMEADWEARRRGLRGVPVKAGRSLAQPAFDPGGPSVYPTGDSPGDRGAGE